jgi:FkbM family methyltransferase
MEKFYSQQGEDILILQKYINVFNSDGIYLELGAVDGITYSNTKYFEDYLGFKGILIEPQKNMFDLLSRNREKNILINKAISKNPDDVEFIGNTPCGGIKKNMNNDFINKWHKNSNSYKVKTSRIDDILDIYDITYIDLFVLDVEGGELDVLETINFNKVEIYLMVIELDDTNPNKDNLCRDILKQNGFILSDKLCINEYWINTKYSKKDRLFNKNNIKYFNGINENKISNLGHHLYIEKHLIDIVSKYIMNNIMNISLLIPCTSNKRDNWKDMKDTYLYNFTLKTFLLTMDKQFEYNIYIGYDKDDRIFSVKQEQETINRFSKVFNNVNFKFVELDVEKGYVTKMWNILFKQAYDDNNEYFYQCGDDINFKTKGWVNDSINMLKNNNDIGISGPINNNVRILTQAMFSRKHMEIFGFLFPESIKNWCCDDWYNWVYQPNHFFPLTNHFCSNDGGQPRYIINGDKNFSINASEKVQKLRLYVAKMAEKDKLLITKYVSHKY